MTKLELKCIWKDIAINNKDVIKALSERLNNCYYNCDGFNKKCDYYNIKREIEIKEREK